MTKIEAYPVAPFYRAEAAKRFGRRRLSKEEKILYLELNIWHIIRGQVIFLPRYSCPECRCALRRPAKEEVK